LVTDPLIPHSLWAALALVSLAAIVAYVSLRPPRVSLRRRIAMGVLLAIAVAGILALLLNPTWEELNRAELGRPSLGILVDASASMDTADCEGQTRFEVARRGARELAAELSDQFEVRFWCFDKEVRPLGSEALDAVRPGGMATDIGSSLRSVLQADLAEEAAVVVVSDGIHNVPGTLSEVWHAAQAARAMAVPVFTQAIGRDATLEDLRLKVVTPDDIAFVGQQAPIRVRVDHAGSRTRSTTDVTLWSEGKLIASQGVAFGDERTATITFPVKAEKLGLFRYVIRVDPLPEEIIRANNQAVFYLRVIDTPIRVLVLEGKPYWDTKFLLRRLAEAKGISVKSAIRLKSGRVLVRSHGESSAEEKGDKDADAAERVEVLSRADSLLESFEKLKEYDVIILGHDVQDFLEHAAVENLCRWIAEWGGSLVCGRGRPLQVVPAALDRVMPVRWQTGTERRFRVRMTRRAEWMGWFPVSAGLMPSLASDSHAIEEKPLATVVARAGAQGERGGMAVVTYQPYGSGRVIVLEGSGLWRWAFLPPGETSHRELYERFWNSLLRWLVASADFLPGETARLRPARTTFSELEGIVLYLIVRKEAAVAAGSLPVIEIRSRASGPGEAWRRLSCVAGKTARVFRATCAPLETGAYVARLVREGEGHAVQCAFDVIEPAAERLDLRSRRGLMKRLAEESGGAVLAEQPAEQVRKTYLEYWKERHPEEFVRTPAWDRSGLLLSLVAILAAVWVVRRRGGLV